MSASIQPPPNNAAQNDPLWYTRAMEHLVNVVQDLSHARHLDEVVAIVRSAARNLTGADGASFILRDHDLCYYVDEDAIAPLWKGQKFPMKNCVSGWVMLNKKPAVIADIYSDERVPVDAYRPTFVKSMAAVPIRKNQPIGVIGNYWANPHKPTDQEITILQALADVTSVALENADLYDQLRIKILALEKSNYELSRFAWSASHDLKSPLRAIDSLSRWVEEDLGDKLQGAPKEHLETLRARVQRMEKLLNDILEYSMIESKLVNRSISFAPGAEILHNITELLAPPKGLSIQASPAMNALQAKIMPLQQILYNLIGNAIKHHDKTQGIIDIDVKEDIGNYIFTVKDDGPGIEARYHQKIFEMFQTLKSRDQKEGSGMGLALIKKIIDVCGGTIELESSPGQGCTFRFTLPKSVINDI